MDLDPARGQVPVHVRRVTVGARCTAAVDITPTQIQNYSGNLVINSSTPFALDVVGLSGAVYNPDGTAYLFSPTGAQIAEFQVYSH